MANRFDLILTKSLFFCSKVPCKDALLRCFLKSGVFVMFGLYNTTGDQSNSMQICLCHYKNASNKLQILRVGNVPNWYFEKVVFPGQVLLFEAPVQGVLEVHTSAKVTTILADTINCDRLRVQGELFVTEDNNFAHTEDNNPRSSANIVNIS